MFAPTNSLLAVNLNERFDVSESKQKALLEKIKCLGIDVQKIEENFVRGGGKGGQKINKTSNCVQLFYPPLGISVRVQRERKRTLNRFLALREMVEQIEMRISPETSEKLKAYQKIRKQKARRERRAQDDKSRGTQA